MSAFTVPITCQPITSPTTLRVPGRYPLPAATIPCRVHDLIAIIEAEFDLLPGEILSRRRLDAVVWPRQIAMALAYETTTLTDQELAPLFRRERSTLTHDRRALEERIATDPKAAAQVAEIRRRIL